MKSNYQNFDETAFNEVDLLTQSMGSFLSSILDEIGESDNELSSKVYGLLALNTLIIRECKKISSSINQ